MIDELIEKIKYIDDTMNYLNKIRFEIGIFDEDGSKIETIKVLNLDGTVSEEKMPLSDIMYLTEKGTLTIPSKPILGKTVEQMQRELPRLIEEILGGVKNLNWGKKEIREKFQVFNDRINHVLIPNSIQMIISSDNVISGILNEKEDQNYTFDLKKLKKFVKSKIFFAN